MVIRAARQGMTSVLLQNPALRTKFVICIECSEAKWSSVPDVYPQRWPPLRQFAKPESYSMEAIFESTLVARISLYVTLCM